MMHGQQNIKFISAQQENLKVWSKPCLESPFIHQTLSMDNPGNKSRRPRPDAGCFLVMEEYVPNSTPVHALPPVPDQLHLFLVCRYSSTAAPN
jgi:hypothetical protein